MGARFLFSERPLDISEKGVAILDGDDAAARAVLHKLLPKLEAIDNWVVDTVEDTVRQFTEEQELKLGKVAQPIRVALTGGTTSPGVFDVMAALPKEECLARIEDQAVTG